ncbi:MAG: hypothetical protein V4662_03935 [Verrucomicrobiota bacterium]
MSRLLHHLPLALVALASLLLSSCQTGGGPTDAASLQQIEYRRLSIASEPRGDYYVGRRFHIDKLHFWGYVRRPGESWDKSRLVVVNERFMRQPDRLPEMPSGDGNAYGSDHNTEYRLWGYFTGRKVYDPNSNMVLPEFMLQRYEVKNASPGWIFRPNEKFDGVHLFRGEIGSTPGKRY